MKLALSIVAAVVCTCVHQLAFAAYTRTSSAPVHIAQIYSNEAGSPFVTFATSVNSACQGGVGLYLYDITVASPDWELRKNKMAILLAAKLGDRPVVLDYFYDASVSGWAACYIYGIQIVD